MIRRRWALPAALVIGLAVGMAAALAVTEAMAHDGGAPPPAETRPERAEPAQDPLAPPDGVATATPPDPRPAYQIIQDEIDRELAEWKRESARGG